ncbi:MAG TPA: outer membrane protein assembly factor BamC [Usitatibacter sp.]|jgi:outer membrane protein assembly factor BamC|nr:outer membrane protein assembly factor BamC [Usitatibacter sp.]
MKLQTLAVACAAAFALAGCAGWGTKSTEYKGAAARTEKPLEVPPELSSPTMDDRYSLPDPHAQTSYSAYEKQNAAAAQGTPGVAGGPVPVLPKVEGVRLERAGDQRWLVMKGTPDQVWPVVRDFWVDSGYPLTREEPQLGIMETDWVEERAKAPQDIIQRTLGKVLPGLWSTPRRDKYRTRLENGEQPGTTEVYVSDRAIEEVYTNSQQDRTMWQPLAADRELEAEMLNRIMAKVGTDASAKLAAAKPQAPIAGVRATAPIAATPVAAPANAVLENGGKGPLIVNDGFDRAWRRVGLALDRVGFTVVDRDRSKGLFFVRYIDPEADNPADKEPWLDKLKFWKSAPKSTEPQYRIQVSDAGASASQVLVQDNKGAADSSSTGRKILALLYDQLK